MPFPEGSWKKDKAQEIADALQDILAAPDATVEDAIEAIDYAIDSWLQYFDAEKAKWEKLKARIHR